MDKIESEIVELIRKNNLKGECHNAVSKAVGPNRWFFKTSEDFFSLVSPETGMSDSQAIEYLAALDGCPDDRKEAFFRFMRADIQHPEARLEMVKSNGIRYWRPPHDDFFTASDMVQEEIPLPRDFERAMKNFKPFAFENHEQIAGALREARSVDRSSLESVAAAIERIMGLSNGHYLKNVFMLVTQGDLQKDKTLDLLTKHLDNLIGQIS